MGEDHLSSRRGRIAVLVATFFALVFDGFELGLMPVASISVSRTLMGDAFTPALGGEWFARFTAALMLGAAIGGILLGQLGDRIGRARAMGVSILFYSVFAALGAGVRTQEQMLLLRFLVGLGVGGVWPNGIALVAECWPNASRPFVSGVMSAGINSGILLLALVAWHRPITEETWTWLFRLAGLPMVLGVLVILGLPESPRWLEVRQLAVSSRLPVRQLFEPGLVRTTLVAIIISSIPLVGAWAASKWMIPWADKVAGESNPGYKSLTQAWWAIGATLGSFAGAQAAHWFGRRLSYFVISIGATCLTYTMFQFSAPLAPSFHPIVFLQGLVSTLFFGWLAVYLPELFPVAVRATGTGLAYNSGRFATAVGVLAAGMMFRWLGGDYTRVGAICSLIYALGVVAIWLAPQAKETIGNRVDRTSNPERPVVDSR